MDGERPSHLHALNISCVAEHHLVGSSQVLADQLDDNLMDGTASFTPLSRKLWGKIGKIRKNIVPIKEHFGRWKSYKSLLLTRIFNVALNGELLDGIDKEAKKNMVAVGKSYYGIT